MRAFAIREFGEPSTLRLMDLPRPKPRRGELLVRVVAAGVNPFDWRICRGLLRERFEHRFPLVPGWDVAGVVEEIGEDATRFRKGDRVWSCARKPTVQWGCYAEYVALPEASIAPMPSRLLFEEAAALPLAALAAAQALDAARVGPETAVLIHGAAGGVGHFAVQLAKRAGARVFGTAGPAKQAFVSSLGADGVLDYTAEDFREGLRRVCPDGVEVVLDTIGGETRERSFDVLVPGGRLVGLVDPPDPATAKTGIETLHPFVEPDGERLRRLAGMVDRKELQPRVQKIYPMSAAAEALAVSMAGHVEGKLVLAL